MDFSFNPYNLLAGFIFGTIGWGSWRYGKRLELWKPQVIGVALMVYPHPFQQHVAAVGDRGGIVSDAVVSS